MTADPQTLERQLRRLEQEKNSLERRAQRYREILDALPLPVCRLQPDGVVSFVNLSCCQALGLEAADLIGRGLLAHTPDEIRQRAAEAWQGLSPEKPSVDLECGLKPGPWTFHGLFDGHGRLEALQGFPQITFGPAATTGAAPSDSTGQPVDSAVAGSEPETDLSGAPRILIVDDENMVCTLAQKVLEKFGFEVEVAQTGKDALAACKTTARHFDVVLLDMSLPDIDGKQVFASMRQLRPDIQVVISSGFDSASSGQRFTGPGVTFLPKPYMPDQLISKIREMIDTP